MVEEMFRIFFGTAGSVILPFIIVYQIMKRSGALLFGYRHIFSAFLMAWLISFLPSFVVSGNIFDMLKHSIVYIPALASIISVKLMQLYIKSYSI